MKKTYLALALIPVTIILLAMEVSVIGALYEAVMHFWRNATEYNRPKFGNMFLDCCMGLIMLLVSIVIPAGYYCLLNWVRQKK